MQRVQPHQLEVVSWIAWQQRYQHLPPAVAWRSTREQHKRQALEIQKGMEKHLADEYVHSLWRRVAWNHTVITGL